MTDDMLHTFLCECKNVVNGRPLTKSSDDVNDDVPITPNHLLILGSNMSLPLGMFSENDRYRRRWRYVQHLVNCFWKRWVAEYMSIETKWHKIREDIKVGDLEMVTDKNSARCSWPLGLVIDVTTGRDSHVRSVKMRSRHKVIVRPITKKVLWRLRITRIT